MRKQYWCWFLVAWLLAACEDGADASYRNASLPPQALKQMTFDEKARDAAQANAEIGDSEPDEREDVESEMPDPAAHMWLEEDPPLRIEARHFIHSSTGLRDYYVILRSHADYLEIQGLTLNRGNCPYSETDQVENGVGWPQYLLFGQRKQVRAKCDHVLEAVVQTQFGEWTFTFD